MLSWILLPDLIDPNAEPEVVSGGAPYSMLLELLGITETLEEARASSANSFFAKERLVSVERLAQLLDYDSFSGQMRWKHRPDRNKTWNTHYAGKVAGTTRPGAIHIRIETEVGAYFFFAHRVAWALFYGAWPSAQIDHEDGNAANNRISNLRQATYSQNNCNRHVVTGKSQFRGVYYSALRSKWSAQIKKNKQWKWLGLHSTAEDAANAYDRAALCLHGEFAQTNASLGLL